jgi:hypothetical protein
MIEIRSANLDTDRDLLVELLLRYLTPRSTARRFDWFYRDNPHGPGAAWLACESDSGEVVGSGAIIPREMLVGGEPRMAGVMADFWMHPRHRTLGPAVKLQRACIEGVAERGWFSFFDLPQQSMHVVYRRLGVLGDERLQRFAKVLRSGPQLEKRLKLPLLARPAGAVIDCALALRDRMRVRDSRRVVALHEGPFGEEFNELALQVSRESLVCVHRSARYLNWRFRDHYFLQHEIYTLREGDRLLGFAAVTLEGNLANVMDVFPATRADVLTDLVVGMARALRVKGIATLYVPLLASSRAAHTLRELGLSMRHEAPVVISSVTGNTPVAAKSPEWFLSYGDIDY